VRPLPSICLFMALLSAGCRTPDSVQTTTYEGWEAICLDNGVARAVFVPGIARLMAFERVGGTNLIWQDTALLGKPADLASGDWRNFGGAKLWVAPQSAWGWPPDPVMDQGPCTADIARDDHVSVQAMASTAVGVRLDRRLQLAPDCAALNLEYAMQNTTSSNVSWSIWNVIQVKGGGRVLLPVPEGTQVREDERWKVWDHWTRVDDLFVLHHTGQEGKILSIGPEGWMAYEKDGEVLVVTFEADPDATYPEGHGCAEVYSGGSYVELEHVAPLVELAPGETTRTTERWILFSTEGKDLGDRELAAIVRRMLGADR
jgi:hypothetical protein